jgi:hypothetical protein
MNGAACATRKEGVVLGEKIGEAAGKIIGERVLGPEDGGAGKTRIEVSVQQSGKLLGLESSDILTYWSETREGGVVYGEGRGVTMTKEGDHCTWRGSGIGKLTGKGMAASYRGSMFYEAKGPRLSRLNGLCVVFEFQIDESGNTKAQLFEWK